MNVSCRLIAFVSLALFPLAIQAAEAPAGARLMPPATLAYVEVTQADVIVQQALDPGLHALLADAKDLKKYFASEQYKQAQVGIALIEARMNARWPQIVQDLAGSVHL